MVVITEGRVARMQLSGELDKGMAEIVRGRLTGIDGDVELDCAGLTFMDSAGISLLVEIYHACVERGARLTVVKAPLCVTRLSAMTGVDRLFDVRSEDAVL